MIYVRWTPHPVIVTIMDNKDYIRVLLYSYYTTITRWGVLLRSTFLAFGVHAQSLTWNLLATIWGFPKIRGTPLGVPIIRTIVFWGLYWGPLNLGNYHIVKGLKGFPEEIRV